MFSETKNPTKSKKPTKQEKTSKPSKPSKVKKQNGGNNIFEGFEELDPSTKIRNRNSDPILLIHQRIDRLEERIKNLEKSNSFDFGVAHDRQTPRNTKKTY